MNQRIDENIKGELPSKEYSNYMTKLTGEYIDEFTTVIDRRTTEEILSREPKCVRGNDGKKESRKEEVKEKSAET